MIIVLEFIVSEESFEFLCFSALRRNEALWPQLSLWDGRVAELIERPSEVSGYALRGGSKKAIRAEMTRRRDRF